MIAYQDLLWYLFVFLAAWVIYFIAYVGGARIGFIRGIGPSTVATGVGAALLAGILSWLYLADRFSSGSAHILACVTAPICFLGFCGIWVLLGPVTVDRSITLTILRALESVEGTAISNEHLISAVPFDRIYEKRLKELSNSGVIELHGNRVMVTPKGKRALRMYLWLGRLLNVALQ